MEGLRYATIELWHLYRYWIIGIIVALTISLRYVRYLQDHNRGIDLVKSVVSGKQDDLAKGIDANLLRPQTALSNAKTAQPSKKISRNVPKRVTGQKTTKRQKVEDGRHAKIQPVVFYFSLTETTSKRHATGQLKDHLQQLCAAGGSILPPQIHDLAVVDHEDFFEHVPIDTSATNEPVRYFYLLLIPSYNIDTALDNFTNLLKETHNDFRIDTAPLRNLAGYSVFGFGDREGWPTEADGFCCQAIEVDKWMAKLSGRKRAFPLGLGDVKSDMPERFAEWMQGTGKSLQDVANTGHLGEGAPGSGDAAESDEEEEGLNDEKTTTKKNKRPTKSGLDDVEDLGSQARDLVIPIDFTSTKTNNEALTPTVKPMVPVGSPTYNALTKQGYTIIGSHSGVKICRWTKSALRGRGSCYKYSFYGIASHLCMETTPALSCSNKCVFCWRHGTNPVGTTWRWEVNPPEMIFAGAKEGHYKKIKMLRGVPGVRAERFQEAMRIRHCALSLVGEPIFYPHINEFTALLHREHISSFLVCNAQHPDQLAALRPVTQLYVSIDASNAESLKKIDRPLHRDYWERFLRCLDILHDRRNSMRTVFRLTLVKGFNIESEVAGYAALVARGLPCFIEVKGVTYCGTSTSASAGLTMQNVPFWEEVVAFVEGLNDALAARGLDYGLAAEHQHSCCALIGSRRFYVDEEWHTLIDYDKFFACLERGDGQFTPEEYMGAATPEWARWGNGGFDPRDVRVDRKGRPLI